MLPTKDLKDILKAASEVTSLASTDRIMVTDANGEPKKLNHLGFQRRRFQTSGIWSILLLSKSSANIGIYGGIYGYRHSGHLSFRLDVRFGDCHIPGWRQCSMLVHPDLRYSDSFSEYDFVTCTFNGESYSAIKVPAQMSDFACYFSGLVVGNDPSFGTLVGLEDVSDVTTMAPMSSVVIIPRGRYIISTAVGGGGGKSLPFNKLRNLTERMVA